MLWRTFRLTVVSGDSFCFLVSMCGFFPFFEQLKEFHTKNGDRLVFKIKAVAELKITLADDLEKLRVDDAVCNTIYYLATINDQRRLLIMLTAVYSTIGSSRKYPIFCVRDS